MPLFVIDMEYDNKDDYSTYANEGANDKVPELTD